MRRIKLLVLIFLISTMFSSCMSYDDYNTNSGENTEINNNLSEDEIMDSGPVKGGVLKLFSTTPDTLNPVLTKNIFVQNFTDLIFEGLFKLNRDQQAVPVLADKWEVSKDGLIWTFHIRDNVHWHDGMPLSADDVKFTLEVIQNNSINSVYRNNIQNIAVFTAVNRNTFRIFLKKPDSFIKELMTFPIIPRHYFSGTDITQLKSEKNMAPIGTGPYKYDSTNSGVIRLSANDKWWNSENKANPDLSFPYISEINVKIYKNETDAITAFQTADVDVAPVQTGDFIKYNGRSDLIIRKYPGKNYEFLAFNIENSILNDKVVRQAISYGIDKTKIINEVMPGEASASDIPIIPGTWLNDTNIIAYNPNKQKARELLLANGWKEDKGVMYKYVKGIRKSLKFELLVNNYNETRDKVAKKIAEQLKDIGIAITIKNVNWDDEQKILKLRKFDMVFLGYRVTNIPDVSYAYSSSETPSGFNVSGFKNSFVDLYLDQIRLSNDPDTKKANFNNMKAIIADEAPYIGLYFYNKAILYNKRIRGDLSPYVWDMYNDITKWYIPRG